jgi:D-alanyl-D-alanine carboxypeptidase/Putative peptidoglycan binding domain
MALIILHRGSIGEAVEQWQQFLIGLHLLTDVADGRFGEKTEAATMQYQTSKGLNPDGEVGPKTYAKAIEDGLPIVIGDPDFPPKPAFPPLLSLAERQALFGTFTYTPDPTPDNPELIKCSSAWINENITEVQLPGFSSISGAPATSIMKFHRRASAQLLGLWKVWEAKDLLKLILTFEGSLACRFIRGSRTVLSNHAFGSAFDINYQWNKLGHTPALVGKEGSVRLLVPIANEYGFDWGGHFNSRKDGMHFEVAKILTDTELQNLALKYGI